VSGTGALVRTIGVRHLVERRLRTALTAGGVAAGVALVFSISSMNAAFNEAIRSTVAAFQGPAELQVTAVATGTIDGALVGRVRDVDGVATAAPVLEARSTLTAGDRDTDAFILGATADLLAFAPSVASEGFATAQVSGSGIAIGERLAGRLQVDIGDRISVGTPARPLEVTVAAVLGRSPLDRINGGMVALVPLAVAQGAFERSDEIDRVLVDVADHESPDVVRSAVRDVVGSAGVVTRPSDAPGDRAGMVQPFLMMSEAIGLIALFVALVLVFNTMSMAMAERRSELALAAALGARRRQLFRAVLIEAAVLGVIGAALGLGGGALLADALLQTVGHGMAAVLPIDSPTGAVLVGPHLLVSALGGVAVAVLGSILPARRVLRTAPIAALRPDNDYEWVAEDDPQRRLLPLVVGLVLSVGGLLVGFGLRQEAPSMTRSAVVVIALMGGIVLVLPTALPLVTDRVGNVLERGWAVVGRLAADALRANPRRTSITLATLILPLATVIGMGTAFSSAQARFHDLATSYNGAPVVVESTSFDGFTAKQPLSPATIALVEEVPGVAGALPGQNVFFTTEDGLAIAYTLPEAMAVRKGITDVIHNARNADDPDEFRAGLRRGEVAVSRLAARNRDLSIGDTLTLPAASGPVELRVASVFDDFAGIDSLYIERDVFLRHWPDDRISGMAVAIDDGADPSAVRAAIDERLREEGIEAKVVLRDRAIADLESELSGLFSISRVVQLAAIVVAGLSLMSTAFTTILERRWSLGLQQALGMSRSQIARSLALEAAAVAVIGGLVAAGVGVAIGVLLTQGFGLVAAATLPVTIPWTVIVACAVGAVALSLLATAYPRRIANRTQIIEALVTE
jgi:putative ABC transport system permease protein